MMHLKSIGNKKWFLAFFINVNDPVDKSKSSDFYLLFKYFTSSSYTKMVSSFSYSRSFKDFIMFFILLS